MLEKNKIYDTVIVDYTAQGQGIAKIEGCAVFVPNALVGEVCRVRIEKAQKTWASGKLVEILEKSPHRINRECPVAKLCGGCDFWHMDYDEETRLKADRVRQALNRIGGENLAELPILPAPTCYGYRNKAQYPVAAKKGRVYAGFFRAGTHQVVENKRCLILPQQTDAIKDIRLVYKSSVPRAGAGHFGGINYNVDDYPLWVDTAVFKLREIARLDAIVSTLRKQTELLEAELRTTSQRVNLFEKVKIPECKENIRRIKIQLGDMETSAVARSKIAKGKSQNHLN